MTMLKRCLIVVDYQRDFVDGSLGFPKALELEKPIADKIREYRSRGDVILFTFDTHGPDYLHTQEGTHLPVEHCLKGTPGHELYGEVAALYQTGDPCFYKPAFGSSQLFDFLREKAFHSIELAGVVSNICVLSNAVLAKTALPEVPVIVDAGCTASNDPVLHKAALDVMEGLQIQITGRE